MSSVPVETTVIVVGAGPAGMSTAACLRQHSIPYVLLEREDCYAPSWKKKAYDCLHLHLPKKISQLPHFPFPPSFPTYIPRADFIRYLNDYAHRFDIAPIYRREVKHARYDEEGDDGKWHVKVKVIKGSGDDNDELQAEEEYYVGRFLVVATGAFCDPFVPNVEGLDEFGGNYMVVHSSQYKSGKEFCGKKVLVVGSGNSGMEIAFDLAKHGAQTSIVVRSPRHVLTREIAHTGIILLRYGLPVSLVDWVMVTLSKLWFGDVSKLGIERPAQGPTFLRIMYGKIQIIDVGTIHKIRTGQIQVLPALARIRGDDVLFENGKSYPFDAIIFATGFKRSKCAWLQGDDNLLNEDGFPKPSFPNHWKGKKGLYCAGLSRTPRGLNGAASDGQSIADHIKSLLL